MKSITQRNGKAGRLFATVTWFGILITTHCIASDVTLEWDASPTSDITNYVLYASQTALTATNLPTATVCLNAGTNTTATVTNLTGHWYFVATAQKDGLESDTSNMVEWTSGATMRVGTLRVGTLRFGTLRVGP